MYTDLSLISTPKRSENSCAGISERSAGDTAALTSCPASTSQSAASGHGVSGASHGARIKGPAQRAKAAAKRSSQSSLSKTRASRRLPVGDDGARQMER